MSQRAIDVLWGAAQVAVAVCTFFLFFVYAPWQGALPTSDASPAVAAGLPAQCQAFTVNHGQYSCFWYGTRSQNPMGYWLCTFLFFSCAAFLIFTGLTGRGLYTLFHHGPRLSP